MSTDDQTNIDDLREELEQKDERISELEQQMHEIAAAVEQPEKMTPTKDGTGISRRELLGAALGGSVLGLGGAAATNEFSDSAKAAGTSAPDVGTPSKPVDVFAKSVRTDREFSKLETFATIHRDGSGNVVADGDSVDLVGSTFEDVIHDLVNNAPPGAKIQIRADTDPYEYSTTIPVDKSLAIVGDGWQASDPNESITRLKYTGTSDAVRFFNTTSNNIHVRLQELGVAVTDANARYAVYVDGRDNGGDFISRSLFDRVFIDMAGNGSHGFYCQGNIFDSTFRDIEVYDAGEDGVRMAEDGEPKTTSDAHIGRIRTKNAGRYAAHFATKQSELTDIHTANGGIQGCRLFGSRNDVGMVYDERSAGTGINAAERDSALGLLRSLNAPNNGVTLGSINTDLGRVETVNTSSTGLKITSIAHEISLSGYDVSGGTIFSGSATDVEIAQDATFNGDRGVAPSSGSLTVSFQTSFTSKPSLSVVPEGEAVWWVSSWSTNGDGNYDGATIQFRDTSGANANPTLSWNASVS